MAIEVWSVKSSNIKGLSYDDETRTGTIEFHGGSVYTVDSVDRGVLEEMASSPSPGSYFARHVRDTYRIKKS